MSSNIKGVASIELRTDRFTGPAKKAQTTLTQLGNKGKQSLDKIKTSVSSASQSFTTLGSRGQQSLQKIQQSANTARQSIATLGSTGQQSLGALGQAGSRAGGQISIAMNQATSSVRQLNLATNQATVSNGTLVLGIAALGTSVGTTFTGMSALNKAHIKQDKANLKVEKSLIGVARANDLLTSTNLAVERFTLAIAKAQRDGKTDTDAYTIAQKNLALQQQKLITAQDDLAVKTKEISIVQASAAQVSDDLSDTYVNMTISLANTGLMSAFLAKTMLPNLSRALIANKLAIVGNSRVLRFLGFDLQKARVILATTKVSFIGASTGVKAFTFSLTGLRLGIRATMAALGPIGLAMIGIGIAFEIWSNNVGGVQEKLADLWNFIKTLIPGLQILENIVQSIFPETEKAVTELADELETAQFGALAFADSVIEIDKSLELVPVSLDTATNSIKTFGDEVVKTNKVLDDFKKKRESFSILKAFGDLSPEEIEEALFGKTGTFSKSGSTILGFIKTQIGGEVVRITDPVTGEQSFINIGGKDIFSRITSSGSFTFGGQGPKSSAFGGGGASSRSLAGIAARTKSLGGSFTFGSRGSISFGTSKGRRGSGPNRHQNAQALAALDAMFGGNRANAKTLEQLTGVNLQLQRFQVVNRGKSGPVSFGFEDLRRRLAEANARISLSNTINLLNPSLNVSARQSSSVLQRILTEQQRQISFTQSTFGIDKTLAQQFQVLSGGLTTEKILSLKENAGGLQIQDFVTLESGKTDLSNILGWNEREELLRTLV